MKRSSKIYRLAALDSLLLNLIDGVELPLIINHSKRRKENYLSVGDAFYDDSFSSHLHMVGKGWWCISGGSKCCIELLAVDIIAAMGWFWRAFLKITRLSNICVADFSNFPPEVLDPLIFHIWYLFEIFNILSELISHDFNQLWSSNFYHALWITNFLFEFCHNDAILIRNQSYLFLLMIKINGILSNLAFVI